MTISLLDDSDGNTYQVWGQRQEMSCAIASIWMARGLARQMSFDEGEWDMACRLYQAAVAGAQLGSCGAGQTFDSAQHGNDRSTLGNTLSVAGFNLDHIIDMIREEGFVVTQSNNASVDVRKIGPTKPALVGVRWRSNASGSWQDVGGHIIVAARQTSNNQIVYLDPGWGGLLRELPNNRLIPHPNRSVTGVVSVLLYMKSRT